VDERTQILIRPFVGFHEPANSLRTADAILDEGAALTWRMILMLRKRRCAALDLSTLINRDRKLARP
jgi:hypothetical protein